jgi:hypothetical protein
MIPSTTKPKGDCYQAAYEAVEELASIGKSPTLTHGWVTPICGPYKGERIRHAWVEVDDACVEVSNGQQIPMSKPVFYSTLTAEKIVGYSPSEAKQQYHAHKQYGRWD